MTVERHCLYFLFGIYEGDETTSRAQNQLRLVLEENLNHFVGVSQEDGLLCSFPLFDIAQLLLCLRSFWSILFCEVEFERLELLVAIQIALEVLEKDNFLVNRFWIVEEIVLLGIVCQALSCILRTALCVVGLRCSARASLLDVVKVEEVRMCDYLGRVIEQNSI